MTEAKKGMKFVYPLQTLLKVREIREKQEQDKFKEAERRVVKEKQKEDELKNIQNMAYTDLSESMAAGDSMQVLTDWNNKGVAPMYSRRALTWRLRQGAVTHELSSSEDPRSWLPGPFQTDDALTLPASLETGTWFLDVAMLDRAGSDPTTLPLPPLNLAIEGRGADGWTEIGSLAVE